MVNVSVLVGRLVKDPEIKYTPNAGVALTSFILAVERPRAGTQKENSQKVDYIRVISWGTLAEKSKEHLYKGRLIAVIGMLQIRTWNNNEGKMQSIAEVKADDIKYLESSKKYYKKTDQEEEPEGEEE